MYIAVVPFAAMISLLLFVSSSHLATKFKRGNFGLSIHPFSAISAFLVVFCVSNFIYLLYFSPLLNEYEGWKTSGRISSMVLYDIIDLVKDRPGNMRLQIRDLPRWVRAYDDEIPHAKSVSILSDYSVQSWIHLVEPTRTVSVAAENYKALDVLPSRVTLRLDHLHEQTFLVTVHLPTATPED
jgi:hypothetical protein